MRACLFPHCKAPVHDDVFAFTTRNGHPAKCHLKIIEGFIVIATEISDNPGVSVTNAAENLATIVCDKFVIEPEELQWYERLPDSIGGIEQGQRAL